MRALTLINSFQNDCWFVAVGGYNGAKSFFLKKWWIKLVMIFLILMHHDDSKQLGIKKRIVYIFYPKTKQVEMVIFLEKT